VTSIHGALAWSIPFGFGLLTLWSVYCLIRNRPPGSGYWGLLGILQVILGLQVLVGIVLLLLGKHSDGPEWLHYAYGGLFPVALLMGGHRAAKRFAEIPWIVFGVASLLICGLTIRALMTGLGVD
jgi:hypothetical protein